MRNIATLVVLGAAAAAFAQDEDPDLAVLSGRVASEAPGNVSLTLRRLVASESGELSPANFTRTATVSPGQAFSFAGLPPCPYELTIEADGCETEKRRVDVFSDVANVAIQPSLMSPQQAASVTGKLTFGFTDAPSDCKVRLLSGAADTSCNVLPDGSFAAAGLRAGTAWAIVDCTRKFEVQHDGEPPQRRTIDCRRIVPLTLAAGANTVELRLDPDEDVRAVIRSSNAGEIVDGSVVDLGPTPYDPFTQRFRFATGADGKTACSRWTGVLGTWAFTAAGPDLPLFSWAKGAHKLRVEAAGFEPLERDVAVDGTTRIELTLKPLPGDYAKPSIDGDAWWVEERSAGGEWKLVASWEGRFRSSHVGPPPVPAVFLTPGEHVLRGVRVGSAPSAPQKVQAGEGRVERGVAFVFPTGWTLRGSLRTKGGANLTGFRAYCFLREDEKLIRERGQDFVAGLDFTVTGLTKGRHFFAFDEEGKHPFAEFDMGEQDVEREFTYRAR